MNKSPSVFDILVGQIIMPHLPGVDADNNLKKKDLNKATNMAYKWNIPFHVSLILWTVMLAYKR